MPNSAKYNRSGRNDLFARVVYAAFVAVVIASALMAAGAGADRLLAGIFAAAIVIAFDT